MLLKYRKHFMNKGTTIYEEVFIETNIPHIYVIGLFSIIDFLYILLISKFLDYKLEKIEVYFILTALLIMNYLVFKFIKVDVAKSRSPISLYVYFGLPILLLLVIVLM